VLQNHLYLFFQVDAAGSAIFAIVAIVLKFQ